MIPNRFTLALLLLPAAGTLVLYASVMLLPAQTTIEAEGSPYSQTTRSLIATGDTPCETISSCKSFIQFSSVSKDLHIHRAFFDSRMRSPGHDNQTVFFIDSNWTVYKNEWIVGCGVDDRLAKEFDIRIPTQGKVKGQQRRVDPFKMYLDCYDLPVKNGDQAFLLYKTNPMTVVYSDRPVVVPGARARAVPPSSGDNITVVACIEANRHSDAYIGKLLQYQKWIGIDHVSLIVSTPFIIEADGGLKSLLFSSPRFIDLLREGFVTIDMWKKWSYNESHHKTSSPSVDTMRKVGCVYQYRDTYDYAITIDTEDFFTPRILGQNNIKYYIKTYCISKGMSIGSCMLKQFTYYPSYCGLNEIPSNGNVTKALRSYKHHKEHASKPIIYKTIALIDAPSSDSSDHNPSLIHGYKTLDVDQRLCAISRMSKLAQPADGLCTERRITKTIFYIKNGKVHSSN